MTTKLRRLAKLQPCLVRLEGICNFDSETTVLAHIRRANIAGMGQKPSDLCAFWACSNCHDVIDGRAGNPWTSDELDSFILHALLRQLDWYHKHEILVIAA